MLVVV